MTDWEIVEKKQVGCLSLHGEQWRTIPAVAVNKTGLSMNAPFVSAFAKHSTAVLILVAKDQRKIGLKFIPHGEFDPTAFKFSAIKSGKKGGSGSRSCHCKIVGERFPDCVGRAYRAHVDASGKVIELELTPENMLR